MKIKQLLAKLQKMVEPGSGVDDNWPVFLEDGEIIDVKAFPSQDGFECHITEANEVVLEFTTKEG